MKNLILGIIGVLIFNLGYSQSTLDENNIGDQHNKMMDKYYKLISTQDFKNLKKQDFIDNFNTLSLEVFGADNAEIISKTNAKFLYNLNNGVDKNIAESINIIKSSNLANSELEDFLVNMINECKTVELTRGKVYFSSKKEDANKRFSGEDLKLALIGINTGLSSFEYWNNNIEKWNSLSGNQNSNEAARAAGPGVGGADVGGAVAGAIWCGTGGTLFLPGVGTVTGAVAGGVAGGLYASTAAAASSLWNALWD